MFSLLAIAEELLDLGQVIFQAICTAASSTLATVHSVQNSTGCYSQFHLMMRLSVSVMQEPWFELLA